MPAVHRATFEPYTECGRPVDDRTLLQTVQGEGEPLTCGSCRRLLTKECRQCKKNVLTYRDRRDERYIGQHFDNFNCMECGSYVFFGEGADERQKNRQTKIRRRENRERLAALEAERAAARALVVAAQSETGQYLPGCAICGAEPRDREKPGWSNFTRSSVGFLNWIYCRQHGDVGKEFDRMLIDILVPVSLDALQGYVERLSSAEG